MGRQEAQEEQKAICGEGEVIMFMEVIAGKREGCQQAEMFAGYNWTGKGYGRKRICIDYWEIEDRYLSSGDHRSCSKFTFL